MRVELPRGLTAASSCRAVNFTREIYPISMTYCSFSSLTNLTEHLKAASLCLQKGLGMAYGEKF